MTDMKDKIDLIQDISVLDRISLVAEELLAAYKRGDISDVMTTSLDVDLPAVCLPASTYNQFITFVGHGWTPGFDDQHCEHSSIIDGVNIWCQYKKGMLLSPAQAREFDLIKVLRCAKLAYHLRKDLPWIYGFLFEPVSKSCLERKIDVRITISIQGLKSQLCFLGLDRAYDEDGYLNFYFTGAHLLNIAFKYMP